MPRRNQSQSPVVNETTDAPVNETNATDAPGTEMFTREEFLAQLEAEGKIVKDVSEKEREKEAKIAAQTEEQRKARETSIENGDLIVTDDLEFTREARPTKVSKQVDGIIARLQSNAGTPMVFEALAHAVGQKYAEDVITAMHALENAGLVTRFTAREVGSDSKRGKNAYAWNVVEETTDGE